MNALRPKESFQELEKVKAELGVVASSANFQLALTYALCEFIMKNTPSAEQLAAVRVFIAVLLNLAEKEAELKPFPTKTLDHSIYLPHPPTKE